MSPWLCPVCGNGFSIGRICGRMYFMFFSWREWLLINLQFALHMAYMSGSTRACCNRGSSDLWDGKWHKMTLCTFVWLSWGTGKLIKDKQTCRKSRKQSINWENNNAAEKSSQICFFIRQNPQLFLSVYVIEWLVSFPKGEISAWLCFELRCLPMGSMLWLVVPVPPDLK